MRDWRSRNVIKALGVCSRKYLRNRCLLHATGVKHCSSPNYIEAFLLCTRADCHIIKLRRSNAARPKNSHCCASGLRPRETPGGGIGNPPSKAGSFVVSGCKSRRARHTRHTFLTYLQGSVSGTMYYVKRGIRGSRQTDTLFLCTPTVSPSRFAFPRFAFRPCGMPQL